MPLGRRKPLLVAAVALTTMWSLTSCGSVRVVQDKRTVGVALTEYGITPQSIRASPGLLTFIVHNYGVLSHNLVVTLNGTQIGATHPLSPGQRTRLTVALVPGHYTMASTVIDDQSLGAYGSLTVP